MNVTTLAVPHAESEDCGKQALKLPLQVEKCSTVANSSYFLHAFLFF